MYNQIKKLLEHYKKDFPNDRCTIQILEEAAVHSKKGDQSKLKDCLKNLPGTILEIAKHLSLKLFSDAIIKAFTG